MTTQDLIALSAVIVASIGVAVAVGSWLVAKAANSVNRQNSLQSIEVAERAMYLGLVERRTKWMNDFQHAFIERQNEIRDQVHLLEDKEFMGTLKWDDTLAKLRVEAGWLFDAQVTAVLSDIDAAQSQALGDYRNYVKVGGRRLEYLEVGPDSAAIGEAHQSFGLLAEHLHRYLYVGDVEKDSRGSLASLLRGRSFTKRTGWRFKV